MKKQFLFKIKFCIIALAAMFLISCNDSKNEPSKGGDGGNSIFGSWVYQDTWTGIPKKVHVYSISKEGLKIVELDAEYELSQRPYYIKVYDFKWHQPTEQQMEDRVNAMLEGCYTEEQREEINLTFDMLFQGLQMGEYAPEGTYTFECDPQYTIAGYKYTNETKSIEPNGNSTATYPYWYRFITEEAYEQDGDGEMKTVYRLKGTKLMCAWGLIGIGPQGAHRFNGEATPAGIIKYMNWLLTPDTEEPSDPDYKPYGAKANN